MSKQILIGRPLSATEEEEVYRLQRDGWLIRSFSARFFKDGGTINELQPESKRRINYRMMDELLALGDLEVNGLVFADLFRVEQASLWHYHKFRIYFAVRNLYYELEQSGLMPEWDSNVIWYASRDWAPLTDLFPGVEFRLEKKEKERPDLAVLTGFMMTVLVRLFVSVIPGRSRPEYLIYYTEKYSTVLDRDTLRPEKGHHILEYLLDRLDSRFGLLTEVIVPKLKGHSDYSFDKSYLQGHWAGYRKWMIEPFMVRAWLNRKLKRELSVSAQKLKNGYELARQGQMSLPQQMALEILRSLHASSRFYLFRYFAMKRFFRKARPKAVVASDENSPLSRSVLDAARSCGISIVGLQHGLIHDLHPAYRYTLRDREKGVIPDLTLVWGKCCKHFLLEKGNYPDGSVMETGQLRTDVIPGLLKRGQKQNGNKPIVIFASQPQRDPQLRRQAAWDIFSAVSRIEGCRLILRLHPREFDDAGYYRAIAEEVGYSGYVTDLKSDLFELIASCDLLITCFSTVGAETVYFEKPLIVLDHLKQDIQGYVREGVAFQATGANDLEWLIRDILNGSLTIDREKYRAFIENYACRIDGRVAERVIGAITSVR
jgi:hypothetical protein